MVGAKFPQGTCRRQDVAPGYPVQPIHGCKCLRGLARERPTFRRSGLVDRADVGSYEKHAGAAIVAGADFDEFLRGRADAAGHIVRDERAPTDGDKGCRREDAGFNEEQILPMQGRTAQVAAVPAPATDRGLLRLWHGPLHGGKSRD